MTVMTKNREVMEKMSASQLVEYVLQETKITITESQSKNLRKDLGWEPLRASSKRDDVELLELLVKDQQKEIEELREKTARLKELFETINAINDDLVTGLKQTKKALNDANQSYQRLNKRVSELETKVITQ